MKLTAFKSPFQRGIQFQPRETMTWVTTTRTTFYLHDDETLLEGLLRTGHNVEFQCREGYCGSCRLAYAHANQPISYASQPLAQPKNDEILPCCCQVQGRITLLNI